MKSKDKEFLRGVCFKKKKIKIKILWEQVGTDAHLKDWAIQSKKMLKKEIKIPCIVRKARDCCLRSAIGMCGMF